MGGGERSLALARSPAAWVQHHELGEREALEAAAHPLLADARVVRCINRDRLGWAAWVAVGA